MKLFASHTSPYARKVRVVLIEKRLDYELVATDVAQADHPAQAHNPLGKIPVLVLEDGFAVFDSPVITEYLDSKTPVGRLIPDDPRPRMLVKRWEALADGIMDSGVAIIMENRRPEELRSSAWIDRQLGKIDRALDSAARELGDKTYCFGEAFSLADAALATALLYLDFRFPAIPWRNTYPQLAKYAERMAERKSFQETAPPAA
jgi:glutathione S-transferase